MRKKQRRKEERKSKRGGGGGQLEEEQMEGEFSYLLFQSVNVWHFIRQMCLAY